MILSWIFIGVLLVVGSICDVKSYSLPVWFLIVGLLGGIAGGLYQLLATDGTRWDLLWGILPGCLSIGLSCVTREQIGYGDGILLLAVGGCLGAEQTLKVWMAGLLVSFAVSVILLSTHKADRNTRIPFVPCLLVGYFIIGGGMLCGW